MGEVRIRERTLKEHKLNGYQIQLHHIEENFARGHDCTCEKLHDFHERLLYLLQNLSGNIQAYNIKLQQAGAPAISQYKYNSLITDLMITVKQNVFMPRRSTATNLSVVSQYMFEKLDKRKQVDITDTDLQTAFNRVCHEILKLNSNALV